MLLLATAFVGSSAFMLGVDCYTTAGLKEVRNFISPLSLFAHIQSVLRMEFGFQ